jgi:hypothetical protein
MHADSFTKVVLSLILLCLVLLTVRGFAGSSPGDEELNQVGRFQLEVVKWRRGQVIMRHDTATGETWRMKNFASDQAQWVAMGQEPQPGGDEAGEAGEEPAPEDPAAPSAWTAPDEEPREISDLETILGTLRKSPPKMRVWAAAQISHGHFPPLIAVPPLIEALKDEEPIVVVAAVEGLERMEDPSALPALRELLSRPEPEVVASAQEAIAAIESVVAATPPE